MIQPILQSSSLRLRPLGLADAARVCALAGDPRIAATTMLVPHPYREEHAVAFIEATTRDAAAEPPVGFVWGVESQDTPATEGTRTSSVLPDGAGGLVGVIGLVFSWPHQRAEMGYWIGVPYWGRGHATQAARAVIAWGFGQAGLNRIDAHHMAHNPASGRVLQNAGMTREGTVREHVKKDGRFVDGVIYSVLRREWTPRA